MSGNTASPRSVLICSPAVPEFDRESGSKSICELIRFFSEEGWRAGLLIGSTTIEERYARQFSDQGVELFPGLEHLERAISQLEPDLALLCFWEFAEKVLPRLRSRSPSTRAVVVTLDLHFLREFREAFQSPSGFVDPESAFRLIRELNTCVAADGVWTVSDKERRLVEDLTGTPGLCSCVPDFEEMAPSPLSFQHRRGVVFIGNARHPPNISALDFLCRKVVPLIDEDLLAGHPLSIVGYGLSPGIHPVADSHPNIQVRGWVPSLETVLHEARLSVVPLLFGAGTKRKVLQSLMCETPVVSTWVGLEGLELVPEQHVLLGADEHSLAEGIMRLLRDEELWCRLARQGRERIMVSHSRQAVKEAFLQAVGSVMDRESRPARLACESWQRQGQWIRGQYENLLLRLKTAVELHSTPGSRLLVVSKGDDRLLSYEGRQARHFPGDSAGRYLGYHPPDSSWAVEHLREQLSRGYRQLVLPAPFFWWLASYQGLRDALYTDFDRVYDDPETAMIFSLRADSERQGVS